jgi:hypothetical protein
MKIKFSEYISQLNSILHSRKIKNFIKVFTSSQTLSNQIKDAYKKDVSVVDLSEDVYNFLIKG